MRWHFRARTRATTASISESAVAPRRLLSGAGHFIDDDHSHQENLIGSHNAMTPIFYLSTAH